MILLFSLAMTFTYTKEELISINDNKYIGEINCYYMKMFHHLIKNYFSRIKGEGEGLAKGKSGPRYTKRFWLSD